MNDDERTKFSELYATNSIPTGLYTEHDAWIQKHQMLLQNIKARLPDLKHFAEADYTSMRDDRVYRFYHHSFKVYGLQSITEEMVLLLRKLAPEGVELNNEDFLKIINDGTCLVWERSQNLAWTKHTRPILEAFFHAEFMIRIAIKYGTECDKAPTPLPSDWAMLLYLYGIR
ncbi:hypothetical protein KP001_09785 [Geomonas subterranea]|uniref:Uncharacterized protein n=1 Tax=Geomonas subterranea TaxID=2847989 RepID=A0ABX8LL57_9BACT|nr:hypothetical protein [Geomonas subterranea]QXE92780.1 hypothetical protein KP001_09785 [Geomonas subterranea]QXM09116.1 hypothetical protein KP002_19490 [Geomonas subterranea]